MNDPSKGRNNRLRCHSVDSNSVNSVSTTKHGNTKSSILRIATNTHLMRHAAAVPYKNVPKSSKTPLKIIRPYAENVKYLDTTLQHNHRKMLDPRENPYEQSDGLVILKRNFLRAHDTAINAQLSRNATERNLEPHVRESTPIESGKRKVITTNETYTKLRPELMHKKNSSFHDKSRAWFRITPRKPANLKSLTNVK